MFHEKIFRAFLIVRAKLSHVWNSRAVQFVVSRDITFLFLFFALYLWGYEWNWQALLAAFGLWKIIKEVFNELWRVAGQLRR